MSKRKLQLKNFTTRKIFVILVIFVFILSFSFSQAAFNKQINYQGKLTNASGVAVTNGTYNMEFALYTVSTGGTAIWTETRIDANRVQITSGLFSVLLGEVQTLSGVDFNQTLYLGVNIGGTAVSPSWDGEMIPRKKLGAVPAAIEAERAGKTNNLIGGNSTTLLGSVPYQSGADTTSLVVPNTTTSRKFFRMTGDGTNGAAPIWDTLTSADVGLENVTNESKATMFTSPTFTGTVAGFTMGGDLTLGANTLTTTNTTVVSNFNADLLDGQDGSYYATASGYIPYTGGTSDVDLGVHNLTVDTNSLFVDSVNHRVGIGTITPDYKFTVKSASTNSNPFVVEASDGSVLLDLNEDINGDGYFQVRNASGSANVRLYANGYSYFNGGNIGIGTTSPTQKLDVNGFINAASGYYVGVSGFASNNSTPLVFRVTDTSALPVVQFKGKDDAALVSIGSDITNTWVSAATGATKAREVFNIYDTAAREAIRLESDGSAAHIGIGGAVSSSNLLAVNGQSYFSGNVGIGTTNPQYPLDISSASTFLRFLGTQTSGGDEGIGFADNFGNSVWTIGRRNTADTFHISRNTGTTPSVRAGELFTILSSGNVGIGTTTPGTKLEVLHAGAGALLVNRSTANISSMEFRNTAGSMYAGINNSADFAINDSADIDTSNKFIVKKTTGNVGIGTSSPLTSLHISKDSANAITTITSYHDTEATYPGINLAKADGSTAVPGAVDDGAILGRFGFKGYDGDEFIDGALIQAVAEGNASNNVVPAQLRFYTNAGGASVTERMRITKDGYVGIGTTSPSASLHVVGTYGMALLSNGNTDATAKIGRFGIQHYTNAEEPMAIFTAQSGSNFSQLDIGGGTSLFNAATAINFNTAANNTTTTGTVRMTINSAGNVGIGTTSPTVKLDIQHTTGAARILSTTGTNYALLYMSNTGGDFYVGRENSLGTGLTSTTIPAYSAVLNAQGTAPLIFVTNNAPAMTILNGGNVGIGTTAPGTLLDISSSTNPTLTLRNTLNNSVNSGRIEYLEANAGNYGTGFYSAYDGNSNYFKIGSITSATDTDRLVIDRITGNVGIGTTAPLTKLNVYGGLKVGVSTNTFRKTLDVAGHQNFDPVANVTLAQIQAMTLTDLGAGSIQAGTYYYMVCFVTADGETGNTAIYSQAPTITLATDAQVRLDNIPISSDPRVTSRKIYRSQAGTAGDYYYLYNIGTIANNTATTFIDNTARNTTSTDWTYNKVNTTAGSTYFNNSLMSKVGEYFTAFGSGALGAATSKASTTAAFGSSALTNVTTGSSNMAFGHGAGVSITTGSDNNAFGYAAMQGNQTGNSNVAIGTNTLRNNISASVTGNVAVGSYALESNVAGNNYNVAIGYFTGRSAQTRYSTFLGAYAGNIATPATVGDYNIAIGYGAGSTLSTGSTNIIIGASVNLASPTTSNQLNIGNLIYGTGVTNGSTPSATGKIGIGTTTPTAVLHLKAGTATANTAPLKFTSGTLLTTPEAGAIEFLSDAYYGTITTGAARKTFAFLESPTFTGTLTAPTIVSTTTMEISSSDLGDGVAGPVVTLGRNTNATNTGAGSINFLDKAGTAGYVWQDAAGNMRINTSSPSNANDTAGLVIGAQTSTRDTKQDISEYTDYSLALSQIINAPLHTFRYIKEVNGYGTDSPLAKARIGFISDEVDAMFMVGNSIDQVSVNGLLMASIKELDLKIKDINNLPGGENEITFSDKLIAWLSNSSNKITRIFTGEICLTDADGTSECLNKNDLRQIKQLVGNSSSSVSSGSVSSSGSSDNIVVISNDSSISDTIIATLDTTPPMITLNGQNQITINVGSTYTEDGAVVLDDVDGSVALIISGSVDTNTPGTYTIAYTASDVAKNIATATRVVNVVGGVPTEVISEEAAPAPEPNPTSDPTPVS